jgi:hypothetical protein
MAVRANGALAGGLKHAHLHLFSRCSRLCTVVGDQRNRNFADPAPASAYSNAAACRTQAIKRRTRH